MSISAHSPAAQAIYSQLELQRATFDLLAQELYQKKARLAVLRRQVANTATVPYGGGDGATGRSKGKVVSLALARFQGEIRQLLAQTDSLAGQAATLEEDLRSSGERHIAETRLRVVSLVTIASRSAHACSPAVVLQIKLAIDDANAEIVRVLDLMDLANHAATRLHEGLRRMQSCAAEY